MTRKIFIAAGLTLLLLLGLGGEAFAQGTLTGSLQGTVKDAQGVAIPGVMVTASSTALVRGKATSTTDAAGIYRFPSLPPGTYLIQAELQGFKKAQQLDVRVGLGQALAVDFRLEMESVKTEITVTAEAPLLSMVSNGVLNNFGQEYINKQPVQRNYYSIVQNAPGVNMDALNPSASNILAYGGTQARQNAYSLDGVNVADPASGSYWLLPSIQWMQEIQVSGLGANAEYGAYTGGVINGITKSGGNTFSGGLEIYYQPESFTSNNAPANYPTDSVFKFQNYALSLGGPVLKDQLWFFVSGEYWQQTSTPIGAADTTVRTIPRFLGKLTYQPTEKLRMSFLGEYDAVTQERRGISSTVLPEASSKQYGPNTTLGLNTEYLINSTNYVTLKLNGFNGKDNFEPYYGTNVNGRIDEESGYAWVNQDIHQFSPRKNFNVDGSWSLFADGLFGKSDSHAFKFGGLYEKASMTDEWLRNGGFTYYDDSSQCPSLNAYFQNPACGNYYIERGFGEYYLKGQQQGLVFYAQDSMRLDRFTVNAGLRWTKYKAGFQQGYGNTDVYNVNFFDPRIGVVWDVFGDARSAVKAHWGRYHGGMFTYLYDREASGKAAIPDMDCYWDGSAFTDCDKPTYISARMGTVDHPYVDEAILTFEHQTSRDISLGLDLINRRFRSMMAMVQTNNDYSMVTAQNNPLTGGTLPIYILNSPTSFALTTDNGSYRDYDSVVLRFQKRYSHGWQAQSSLVWTDLKGNIASNSGYANAFRDRNGFTNIDGRMALSYSQWEFKVSGSVDLPLGFLLSGQYTFLSGQYWTPYVRINRGLNYNSSTGRDINLVPQGSEQFADRNLLALRAAWGLQLGGVGRLELSFEVFNTLNTGTVLDNYNRWGTYDARTSRQVWTKSSTYGDPYTIEQPRQFRLGARFTF